MNGMNGIWTAGVLARPLGIRYLASEPARWLTLAIAGDITGTAPVPIKALVGVFAEKQSEVQRQRSTMDKLLLSRRFHTLSAQEKTPKRSDRITNFCWICTSLVLLVYLGT